jgi:hypothetical protein
MMEHVPPDQISPKMNKDENMQVVVHVTWELAAQKEKYVVPICDLSPCQFHSQDVCFGGNFDDWTSFDRLVTFLFRYIL